MMHWMVWSRYVPRYRWDEKRGIVVVMKDGQELRPEEIDPGYHYYRRKKRTIWQEGEIYERSVSGSQLVQVRPFYYMVAPYYEGPFDMDSVEQPIGTYGWLARLRLGREHGADPAIWVIQNIYDSRLHWLTITEYPEGRVIAMHEVAPADIEDFATVCPNPWLDPYGEVPEHLTMAVREATRWERLGWEVWDSYVPRYRWDEKRGIVVVMRDGTELRPEEIDTRYHYYQDGMQIIGDDGSSDHIREHDAEKHPVQVRPFYYMVAPYYDGPLEPDEPVAPTEPDTVVRPGDTYDWFTRWRLGRELGAEPAIWILQEAYDFLLYWLTVSDLSGQRVITKHIVVPEDVARFAEISPNPPLDPVPSDVLAAIHDAEQPDP